MITDNEGKIFENRRKTERRITQRRRTSEIVSADKRD